ncbi:MAG: T9SS type A sorting domain-containing protein [bacterium]
MVEVFNLEGMPVYKIRSEEEKSFVLSDLEGKGLPCGIYFVRIKKPQGTTETAKLLIC